VRSWCVMNCRAMNGTLVALPVRNHSTAVCRKNSHYLKLTDENYGRVRLAEYRKPCTEDTRSKKTCTASPTTEGTR
jgi:hypothetical protein